MNDKHKSHSSPDFITQRVNYYVVGIRLKAGHGKLEDMFAQDALNDGEFVQNLAEHFDHSKKESKDDIQELRRSEDVVKIHDFASRLFDMVTEGLKSGDEISWNEFLTRALAMETVVRLIQGKRDLCNRAFNMIASAFAKEMVSESDEGELVDEEWAQVRTIANQFEQHRFQISEVFKKLE